MRPLFFCCCWLLSFSKIYAMLSGNPAQPALQTQSLLKMRPTWVSFRTGYIDDWVYHQKFRDEVTVEGTTVALTGIQLSTYAGVATLNFKDRIDFYGIVGSSRIQIENEIFTKPALSWGVGGKLIIFEEGNFFIGTDFKYFQTNQKPRYLIVEGLPYNIMSDFRLIYRELLVSVGMAYRISICAPYINLTYLAENNFVNRVIPDPQVLLVRLPDVDELADVPLKRLIVQERWGMALGLTLIDKGLATLAVEWRAFNQNAVDWNFEFRF